MLSFFQRGVLDEILDLIESVSEGFPTYSLYFTYFTISSFLHIQMILCSVCRRFTLGLTKITSERVGRKVS